MPAHKHIPEDTNPCPNMKRVKPEGWNPKTLRVLWILLWGLCAMSLVAEFFIHPHPHFEETDTVGFATDFFGFNAVLGFVACTIMILVAKLLALFLKRKPDYYDKDA